MKAVRLAVAVFLVSACLRTMSVYAQAPKSLMPPPENMAAVIDMLRGDVQAQHQGVITQVMQFSDDEARVFWPIYREFEAELTRIGTDRVAAIKEYVENINSLTDEKADRLVGRAIEFEARRLEVKKKYYERFKKALGPLRAAKFMQLENQLLMMMDLQIASNLPFIR